MKKLSISVLIVVLAINLSAICQNRDEKLIRAITKATTEGIDYHKQCHKPYLFFSIAVSFDTTGKVEKVLLSEPPECIRESEAIIVKNIGKRVNMLSLDKSAYGNKYLILACAVVLSETTNIRKYEIDSDDWASLFKKLDLSQFSKKDLLQITTSSIYVSPRISN